MVDVRVWSDLAQECEKKGIKWEQGDSLEVLREKLRAKKAKSKPQKK